MNVLKFLESFTDDSSLQAPSSRRESLSHFGTISKKTALSAIPGGLLALLLVPGKSSANIMFNATEDANDPVVALQLALMLEYLDGTFYQMGLDTNNLIPAGRARDSFAKIAQNEQAHQQTLIQALGGTGSPNYFAAPQFDYTGGMGSGNGPFNPFNDYQQFLAMSQAFEDTGVKAYKGQAPNLMSDQNLLQSALQIHATEARQAAEVRQLRQLMGWVGTAAEEVAAAPPAMQAAAQMIYGNESINNQGGVNAGTVTPSQGAPALSANAAAEAFDEPLTRDQVIMIAKPFLPGGNPPGQL